MQLIPLLSQARYEREQRRKNSDCASLWNLLDEVKDPEIPSLSIWDLGVLSDIQQKGSKVTVTITPTYSGCPAMGEIREDIEALLRTHGVTAYQVQTRLAPAWTTDWMSDAGRVQLRDYGIAPPISVAESAIHCPQCGSDDTRRISEFGSTACKALYQCNQCGEAFDYFKAI